MTTPRKYPARSDLIRDEFGNIRVSGKRRSSEPFHAVVCDDGKGYMRCLSGLLPAEEFVNDSGEVHEFPDEEIERLIRDELGFDPGDFKR